MKSILDDLDPQLREQFQDELLCLADSKLVLGNWFAECVMNGRSLPDFAAMLGMCTASYGQTRAIYQYLASLDHSYAHLERGRGAADIASMNLLDAPPEDWADFIVAVWLAEQAAWSLASGFLGNPERTIAGLARKIGEEAYFHFKYSLGWFRILAGEDEDRAAVREALLRRFPLALQWFGPPDAPDPLHDAGLRKASVETLRAGFVDQVREATSAFEVDLDEGVRPWPAGFRLRARRIGDLPPGLFEVIRFKDPELAR